MIALILLVLLALAGPIFGTDSRDGSGWHHSSWLERAPAPLRGDPGPARDETEFRI
ncbi:MAG: hypothetical protein ABIS86_11840 [Streptosporangiaceae bacterium]